MHAYFRTVSKPIFTYAEYSLFHSAVEPEQVPAWILLQVGKPCCGTSGAQDMQVYITATSRNYRPGATRCSSLSGYRSVAATSTLRSLGITDSWMRLGTNQLSWIRIRAHVDWERR
ncbi:uncharacterized protein P174DRAFT_280067 [Aspergillus novofumigatus IBT 16806]|uniref:Uncharacterized protein n=1 Tax=Aspergillus novofumigatus (strain IBT 16806) TaxID=1392255 RepID=A0A2I1C045_ASPN1|nr:uncharacterized protein P174DRAFT_280067 [Aspergillus novofumigatus IBT 16806]PKX90994.1 hypothetical protein P174DRAFT_280067 [Aspergillus novofumigatus IBT 16806]